MSTRWTIHRSRTHVFVDAEEGGAKTRRLSWAKAALAMRPRGFHCTILAKGVPPVSTWNLAGMIVADWYSFPEVPAPAFMHWMTRDVAELIGDAIPRRFRVDAATLDAIASGEGVQIL